MMMGPSQQVRGEFASLITEAVKRLYSEAGISDDQILLSISKAKPGSGDISSSISFGISKQLKRAPQEIAKSIASGVKFTKMITSMKDENGYVNASINEREYARLVFSAIAERGEMYTSNSMGKGRKVLIEFPAVNPGKPWHIGHLRNAILGDTIANVMAASSYNVEREDYIDDLGLQIAESLWGYMNLSDKPDKKFDQWLGEQYVNVNKIMAGREIKSQIDALAKRMEELDTKEAREARSLSERCVKAQYETAFNYGIYHDVMIWESDIVRAKLLAKAMAMGMEKGVFEKVTAGKYANCIVVNLEKVKGVAKDFENPSEDTKVLVRSNGTATYVAKDIAFHMWKFGIIKADFHYNVMLERQENGKPLYTTAASGSDAVFGEAEVAVNVIGSAQRYPQLILKAVLELIGYKKESSNIVHVSYGEVGIEGGSLSGRKGGWLGEGKSFTADTLLEEVKAKALEIVNSSEKIKDKSKSGEIAKAVAIGAIKFEFLRIAPEKRVTFSWERALNFESSSAPYCMYTYARSKRILEKAGYVAKQLSEADYGTVERDLDFELLKMIGEAQETVEKACSEYRPNVITDYLLNLSSLFSRFYEKMPVIKGGNAKDLRLALVSATMGVTKQALSLLGIDVVDYM